MSSSGFVGPRRAQVRITIPEASKIIDANGKQHVVYTVQIRALNLHRQVAKKFSEFRTFDTVWRSKYPSVAATLPPKVWLNNKSEKVIAERQVKLEAYLNVLVDIGSVIPYLAKFLGVAVEVLKPRSPPAPPDQPSVTHYRRRRNSGSATQASNGSSASNLRSLGTRSEIAYDSSVNLSEDLVRTTPPVRKSETRPDDTLPSTRSELMRRAEAMSAHEGGEVKSVETLRRTEVSITRTVTDFTPSGMKSVTSKDKSVEAATPSSEVALSRTATLTGTYPESTIDFNNILMMALEAVLVTPVSAAPSASAFMEHDADIGSILSGNWDHGLVGATDLFGVRRPPDTYIL